jgi:hypothetical protein
MSFKAIINKESLIIGQLRQHEKVVKIGIYCGGDAIHLYYLYGS